MTTMRGMNCSWGEEVEKKNFPYLPWTLNSKPGAFNPISSKWGRRFSPLPMRKWTWL